MDLDANGYQLQGLLPFRATKRITFAGETDDAIGDKDGALASFPIFTVTGDVQVFIFGICKTSLVGAGTLEVGVVGNTASLLAQISDVTALDENMTYLDATPALAEGVAPVVHPIGGGLDIKGKTTGTDITAGVIDFFCFWRPLSDDGNLVAA